MTGGDRIAARLEQERRSTTAQLLALAADHEEVVAAAELVSTDDEHDPEGATSAFERARIASLLTRARDLIAELDRAQRRLQEGSYGSCLACGERIDAERLDARPTAETCIRCARRPPQRRRTDSESGPPTRDGFQSPPSRESAPSHGASTVTATTDPTATTHGHIQNTPIDRHLSGCDPAG